MALVTTDQTIDNLDVEVRKSRVVTVISGQNLSRGDLVQKTAMFTAATAVAGSNTGDGAVSGEVANDTAMGGTYTLVCTAAATDSGTFAVYAPDGSRLADATVAVAYSGQIGFTIADGSADFIVGDSFTIAVTEGLGKVTAFTTGSRPYTVMQEDVDATSGDVAGLAYRDADILASEVDFGTGTDAEVRDALAEQNIFLMD